MNQLSRWASRVAAVVVTTAGSLLVWAAPARADDTADDCFVTCRFGATDSGGRPLENYHIELPEKNLIQQLPELTPLNPIDDGALDSGRFVAHLDLSITSFIFELVKMVVGAACWLLRLSTTFTLPKQILRPIDTLFRAYDTHVVGRLGLVNTALLLCVFWFGLAALRGRVGKGVGQITFSLVLAAIGGIVFAAPSQTLVGEEGLPYQVREFSVEVSGAVVAEGDVATAQKALEGSLVDTLVRQPHQLLMYRADIDHNTKYAGCKSPYDKMIEKGATGDDAKPVGDMKTGKCKDVGERVGDFSFERPIAAILVLITAILVFIYVLLAVALPVLGSQLILVALTVAFVFVLPVSLVGGVFRTALWQWLGLLLTAITAVMIAFFSLALFQVTVKAISEAATEEKWSLLVRMTLIALVAILLVSLHRSIQGGTFSKGLPRFIGRRVAFQLRYGTPYLPNPPTRPDFYKEGKTTLYRRSGAELGVKMTKWGAKKAGTAAWKKIKPGGAEESKRRFRTYAAPGGGGGRPGPGAPSGPTSPRSGGPKGPSGPGGGAVIDGEIVEPGRRPRRRSGPARPIGGTASAVLDGEVVEPGRRPRRLQLRSGPATPKAGDSGKSGAATSRARSVRKRSERRAAARQSTRLRAASGSSLKATATGKVPASAARWQKAARASGRSAGKVPPTPPRRSGSGAARVPAPRRNFVRRR